MFVHNFQGGVNLCGEKKFFLGGGIFFGGNFFLRIMKKKTQKSQNLEPQEFL